MQELLKQLEALFIGALPTTALFVVLVIAYQILIQGPLTKTLKERRARTSGAVEDARKAIADAEQRTIEYGERLRTSRAEVYKAREAKLQVLIAERERVIEEAQQASVQQVEQARQKIEAEVTEARVQIESQANELADKLLGAVLPKAAGGAR